jgi:hypothetical protein
MVDERDDGDGSSEKEEILDSRGDHHRYTLESDISISEIGLGDIIDIIIGWCARCSIYSKLSCKKTEWNER